MNPFRGNDHIIEDPAMLLDRANEIQTIRNQVIRLRDTLLMGPEGVGKSSVLHTALSPDFRREAAEQHHILVTKPFDYPVRLEKDRIFSFLVDQIVSALHAIQDEEKRQKIENSIVQEKIKYASPEQQLKNVINNILHEEYGFKIVFVIDNFERFTTSAEVTMTHHEILRGLMEDSGLRFIAATNYDIERDSLPPDVKGSYLLQKFQSSKMRISELANRAGLRPEISACLQEEFGQIGLEPEQIREIIHQIVGMTGGIPGLLMRAAAEVYDQMEETPWAQWTAETWAAVQDRAYQASRILLEHWCKMLNQVMINALKQVSENNGIVNETGGARLLCQRGLIVRCGGGNRYGFVSELLARYVAENQLTVTKLELSAPASIPFSVDPDKLREFAQLLAQFVQPERSAEQAPQIPEMSQEDARTLETIYEQYRKDYPTEMPDNLADNLGEFCMKELKQALLLKALGEDPQMGDMRRAALTCYGVTLERRLRDCFYDVATSYSGFSQYEIVTPYNRNIGAFMTLFKETKKDLPAYCLECGFPQYDRAWWDNLINKIDLVRLLRNPTVHPDDISTAIEKMNLTGRLRELSIWTEGEINPIEIMHYLLLNSEEGLLAQLSIGQALFNHLCGGVRKVTQEDKYRLIGKTISFLCQRIKLNGGLGGVLQQEKLGASVSPRKVQEAQKGIWQDFVPTAGCCFDVRIEQFDEKSSLFIVTPVSSMRSGQ